ncbi:MAG: hypothetical protein E7415_01345 [Ruminococcaceae bacterium]|nr:hypothetical protein [Oscillospiraceae bacterium]
MSTDKVYVTDFGAAPGTGKVLTKAFQNAIDRCFLSGGGEVLVPSGEYIIGDIRLRSNVTLHLMEDAKLMGSKNPKDYMNIYEDELEPLPKEQATKAIWYRPGEWTKMGGGFKKHLYTAGSYWNYGMIRAVYAENIAIIGEKGSVIDGRNVYDPDGEEEYRGPHGINMHFCKNVRFDGYTVVDAGNWAHAIFQSENISFENLTVVRGHDALHTRACDNVLINNCKLETGDDCIAGFNNNNVVIKNCELSSACSAFRYGGNNVLIENCKVYGPCKYQFRGSFAIEDKVAGALYSENGRNNLLSFYTNFVSDDLPVKIAPGKIVVRNCSVKGADRFLHLNLSGNEPWQRGNAPTDITFESIKAEGIEKGLTAYGNGEPDFSLKLKNIDYTVREGSEKEPFMRVANFEKIELKNVRIYNYKGEALVKSWSEGGEIICENVEYDAENIPVKINAKETFECNVI